MVYDTNDRTTYMKRSKLCNKVILKYIINLLLRVYFIVIKITT